MRELTYIGCCTINVVVPAAVVAAMGVGNWEDAGKLAERAGLTSAISGVEDSGREVVKTVLRIAYNERFGVLRLSFTEEKGKRWLTCAS
ncbi:hypothetical protein [Desulfoscipio gibsoniae]